MPLRVLIVEDSEDDAKLLVRLLTKEGFEVTSQRVDTAEAMQAALEGATWDVVLADHTMPEFSALGALDTLKHTGLDLPFIIVSGLIGEEVAVAAMKAGAHDYIRKNNMTRLAPAIGRELHEAVVRRERRQAVEALEQLTAELEQRVTERTALLEAANQELRQMVAQQERAEAALRQSEEEYRATFDQAAVGVAHVGLDGRFLRVNQQLCAITGYSAHELTRLSVQDITYPADAAAYLDLHNRLRAGEIPTYSLQKRYVRKDGSLVWVGVTTSLLRELSKQPRHFISVVEDIDRRKRSEEELRKLSAAVEQSPSAVIITDIHARIEYVNPKFTELTGYTAEEVKGQNPRFLKSGHTSLEEYRALWETITSGRMWRGHFFNKKKNGELYWESASISPIINTEGTITHYVAVKQDITERKTAEAERDRLLDAVQRQAAELDAIITGIADMVVIYDPSGKIVRMNETADETLSYSPDERDLPLSERTSLTGVETPDGRLMSPEDTPGARALRGETVKGVVLRFKRSNHWVTASAAPICAADGTLLGAVVTMSDITALHKLQEQHEEYVGLISHDLRSPLSSILGQADLLRQRVGKQGLTQDANIAAAVVKSAKRMNTMIQELVDSARLEAGRLELSKKLTDVTHLVRDIVDRTVSTEDRARVVVEAASVPLVMLDAEHIERVIGNLLSNALKYSPPASPIAVRFSQQDGAVALCVTDRGVGIPREDIPHLFQRYYRGKTAQRHEGLGLGLYISRLIIEAHGGKVSVESEVGKGSTFCVALPLD